MKIRINDRIESKRSFDETRKEVKRRDNAELGVYVKYSRIGRKI